MTAFREDMLRPLTDAEHETLRSQGYLVYKSEAVAAFRDDVVSSLQHISLQLLHHLGVDTQPLRSLTYDDLLGWCLTNETDQRYTRLLYEMYQSTAAVISLINHPLPLFLARQAGVRVPLPGTLPTIRIDRPGVTKYLTSAHQDHWYSLVSKRAVVLWLPLVALRRDMGLLGVVPGSHKHGLHPFEDAGTYTFKIRDDYPAADYVECDMAGRDEILMFDQFLVHRSGTNEGRLPRVTMQLRFHDLEAMDEVAPTFTAVTSKYVTERQKALLLGTAAPPQGGADRRTRR